MKGCVRILDNLAEVEDSLSKARASPRGRLRASTPNALIHQAFFPALPRFLAQLPGAQPGTGSHRPGGEPGGRRHRLRRARGQHSGRFDAGRASHRRRLLAYVRLAALSGGARHAAQDRGSRAPQLHPVHLAFHRPRHRLAIRQRKGKGHVYAARQSGRYVTGGSRRRRRCGRRHCAGFGRARHARVLRSRVLRPLFVEWAVPAPAFTVVYPSGRYLTAKVRAFTDFVTEVYPMKGWWDEVIAMPGGGARRPRKTADTATLSPRQSAIRRGAVKSPPTSSR